MGLGMSAFRGETDGDQRPSERPLIATSGHPGDGKKSGIFPERATKDSSLPHKPLVAFVNRICYRAVSLVVYVAATGEKEPELERSIRRVVKQRKQQRV